MKDNTHIYPLEPSIVATEDLLVQDISVNDYEFKPAIWNRSECGM